MAAPADILNTTNSSSSPVTLTDTLAAIEHLLDAAEELADIEPRLRARIEANRRRSERHRHNGATAEANGNGNGHGGDLAVKLTNRGLVLVCRRCGTEVTA